jgi:hypothetical protein
MSDDRHSEPVVTDRFERSGRTGSPKSLWNAVLEPQANVLVSLVDREPRRGIVGSHALRPGHDELQLEEVAREPLGQVNPEAIGDGFDDIER